MVEAVRALPFYEGLLYNEDNDATLMMVVFDHAMLNSPKRGSIVEDIVEASPTVGGQDTALPNAPERPAVHPNFHDQQGERRAWVFHRRGHWP